MTRIVSPGSSLSRGPLPRSGPWLVIDRDSFLPKFNTQACFVHHKLVDHPFFDLPALLALAKRLPAKYVRINSGNVPVGAAPAEIPETGLSIEESFARLEDSDTRILLKKIELDDEYRGLLHSCLAEIEALEHPATQGIFAREGYVFLSAPNMITPYHMDPEINFLLQIRGHKTFFVLSGSDRSILSEEDIELFYAGLHDRLPFTEEWTNRAVPFDMAPGDGVHIPVNHPHWVKTSNEVTISFALTLQTTWTKRRGIVYAVNHALRRRGLKPISFGRSPLRDFLKYQGYRIGECREIVSGAKTNHPRALTPTPDEVGLCCQVVTSQAEIEPVLPAWSDLLERSGHNELTMSPQWLLTWWQVYGGWRGRQLRLGLFHEGGRLVGLAPLLLRRHWYRGVLPFRRLEFLASGEPAEHGIHSNHLSILAELGAEEKVIAGFVRALVAGAFGEWDEVVLPMMASETAGLLVIALRAAGIQAEMTVMARAPYIALPATWDAWLASLGANGRRNVQRSTKAFDTWSGGTTRIERVNGLSDLEKGKRILVQLHHTRWEKADHKGVFHSRFYLRFHDLIMRWLLERGSLDLMWLCARGEPVAVLYLMNWCGKVCAYQTGRRLDVPGMVRPGAVLLSMAIRQAIEAGRREFDLLADEAPYKLQLTSQVRPLVRVRAARRCLREGLRWVARWGLGRIGKGREVIG